MKPFAPLAAALALASGATLALAAGPIPEQPAPVWPKHDLSTFAVEPAASARTGGPDADVADAIAQAINADPELKHAKITVQPEGDSVLLTGVALNNAQRQRAGDLATQNAGGRIVVNVIQSEELSVAQPAAVTVPTEAAAATETVTTAEPVATPATTEPAAPSANSVR